jgi:hypothetical protein
MHCKDVTQRQVGHSLGKIYQGHDVTDGVSIGLLRKGSWGRRVSIRLEGPRGQLATLVMGGMGCGV